MNEQSNITINTIVSTDGDDGGTNSSRNTISISKSLDLMGIVKASQALSGEIQLDKLFSTLMQVLVENAGAQTAALILRQHDRLVITAQINALGITSLEPVPLESCLDIPVTPINYVWRTQEVLVFDDASLQTTFAGDPYIIKHRPKSMLCKPILNQGKLLGILYLENNLASGAFTSDRLQTIDILSTQGAISLENCLLYQSLSDYSNNLSEKVEERTLQLQEQNQRLETTLEQLKLAQAQLIQAEKMSSLGQMVAGIAHEINNPVNFIDANLFYTDSYIKDLLSLLAVYQESYPNPSSSIQEITDQIDFDFLQQDLPEVVSSMKSGAKRISNIVLALRNFSRLDEAELKSVDIHEGIDSALMILQHRLREQNNRPAIEVIKEYSVTTLVTCYVSQLNQVFMDLLDNAIDAIEESKKIGKILIKTEMTSSDRVRIAIADNGCGIATEVQKKIFDPFFTTKSVVSGTGLGLSISYQIVVEKHKGSLECYSELGKGTEFIIEIPNNLSI